MAEGDWLVALKQLAGKGRQGRQWVSAPGNFYGSTLVVLRDGDPAAPSLSLVSGLALIEAVNVAAPGSALLLKWPNDLLLLGRKLGGILLERSADRVAVGFGVNLAAAPPLTDRQAARLDGVVTPQGFAPLLAATFSRLLQLWRTAPPKLLADAWLAKAHPLGTPLTVHGASHERISGRFAGLETDGALRLAIESGGIEIIRAGDVLLG